MAVAVAQQYRDDAQRQVERNQQVISSLMYVLGQFSTAMAVLARERDTLLAQAAQQQTALRDAHDELDRLRDVDQRLRAAEQAHAEAQAQLAEAHDHLARAQRLRTQAAIQVHSVQQNVAQPKASPDDQPTAPALMGHNDQQAAQALLDNVQDVLDASAEDLDRLEDVLSPAQATRYDSAATYDYLSAGSTNPEISVPDPPPEESGFGFDLNALAANAALYRCKYQLERWLVNGRDRARVAIILETDDHLSRTRLLLLKVPATEDRGSRPVGYDLCGRAYTEAPPQFAVAHLTALARVPIRVDDGQWALFHNARNDVDSFEVLTTLLEASLGWAATVDCPPADFALICNTVVSGVLELWNGRPRTAERPFTVAEFLGRHILRQLEPGGRLHALSEKYSDDQIEIPGEGHLLVNPFALARGALFGQQRIVRGLVGKTHGDLRMDNVLVRAHPTINIKDFCLIDLACYESDGPLTRDPAHLLLSILARYMHTLSLRQQHALLLYLLVPHERDRSLLPAWLVDVVDAVDRAFHSWLEPGLDAEWRQQRLLSLAGCAMLFLGRKSTRPTYRSWFLRLAARAADQFVRVQDKRATE